MNKIELEKIIKIGMGIANYGIFRYDYKTKSFECSDNYIKIMGLPKDYVWKDSTFEEIVTEPYREIATQLNKELLELNNEKKEFDIEYQIRNYGTKELRWINSRGKKVFDEENEPECVVGVVVDITDIKKLQSQINEENNYLDAIIRSIPDYIFIKEYKGRDAGVYIACNRAVEKMMRMKESDLIGKTDYEINNKEDAEKYISIDKECMENKNHTISDSFIFDEDGMFEYYEVLLTPYMDSYDEAAGVIGIGRNATKRKKMEDERLLLKKRAEEFAYFDFLTKVHNRNYLNINSLEIENRCRKEKAVTLMIDINWFKEINDMHGHLVGDKVLIRLGAVLNNLKKYNDIAIRYGGDEFLIFLFDRSDEEIEQFINQFKIDINSNEKGNSLFLKTINRRIELAVGYYLNDKNSSLEKNITMADKRMYEEKKRMKVNSEKSC